MDKWLKDIFPDKDPYHNRRRNQMRKNGIRNSSACASTMNVSIHSENRRGIYFNSKNDNRMDDNNFYLTESIT